MKPLSEKLLILAVLILGGAGPVATGLYLPSLPSILEDFETTQAIVQLTLSSYLISFGASQLFYGPLSDQIGRKRVVLFGLFLAILGCLVSIFSWNISVLVAGRFIQGLGFGSGMAVMRAILRDAYQGDRLAKNGSYVSVGSAVFMAAAPIVGGYIQSYISWQFDFVFIILYCLLALFVVIYFLPETNRDLNPKALCYETIRSNYRELFTSPVFMGYAACSSLTFSGLAAYLAVSPFLFQKVMGLSSVLYGWLAIFIAAGLASSALINSFLVRKVGRPALLRWGSYLEIFAALLMLIPVFFDLLTVWLVMIPMLIYMLGAGFVFSNSFAGAFHFYGSIAGFAGAAFGSLQVLGGAIASTIMMLLHANDQMPLALFLFISSALCFFFQKLGHRFSLRQDKMK